MKVHIFFKFHTHKNFSTENLTIIWQNTSLRYKKVKTHLFFKINVHFSLKKKKIVDNCFRHWPNNVQHYLRYNYSRANTDQNVSYLKDLLSNSFLLPIITSLRNAASEHSFLQENYKQYFYSSIFLKLYTGEITKHIEVSIF